MNMTRQTTIILLVVTELSVELTADFIQHGLSLVPWETLPRVFDIAFCTAMMTSIIVAIVLLDPKTIEQYFIVTWKILIGPTKKLVMRVKRKKNQRCKPFSRREFAPYGGVLPFLLN